MGICSEATVKRWIASGKLKSYKFGRSRKIAESDLNEFIKTCRR
ncbi:helix-turn-helix domain-containing protein [Haemophilus influenzae]|nr:helix-turn-helix domain-containing protein [Haemophilus influenzae]